jgi:hypothetical protein
VNVVCSTVDELFVCVHGARGGNVVDLRTFVADRLPSQARPDEYALFEDGTLPPLSAHAKLDEATLINECRRRRTLRLEQIAHENAHNLHDALECLVKVRRKYTDLRNGKLAGCNWYGCSCDARFARRGSFS